MTFEQFQQTKTACPDLGAALSDDILQGQPGFLYLGTLYIETVTETWPEEARDRGQYHLLIERDEWISNDLESLERKLYAFARTGGFFEHYVHVVGPHDSGFTGPFIDAASADRYREIDAKRRPQFTLATVSYDDMHKNMAEFGKAPVQRPDQDIMRDVLIAEYQDWMKAEGLALGSADEHHNDENLTPDQRDWVRNFSARWEENEQGKA